MVRNPVDPYRAFNFVVQIDAIVEAQFQECSGLDSQTAVIDYREGDDKGRHLRRIPGLNSYTPITLKRGMTDSNTLWEWHRKACQGTVERKTISIILLDENREQKKKWNVREAWPSKWTGPAFNATANAIAIETLELVYEGLTGPGE